MALGVCLCTPAGRRQRMQLLAARRAAAEEEAATTAAAGPGADATRGGAPS